MPKPLRIILRAALLLTLPMFAVGYSHAQIMNAIEATVSHPFTITNTTLPPGKYTFRTLPDTELTVMTATNEDGKTSVEFLVNEAQLNHTPNHSELFFNRYDNRDFLEKIFEQGNRIGVAVAEPSRAELRLQRHGKHAVEHSEP